MSDEIEKKGKGCCFYGCIGMVAVVLILVVTAVYMISQVPKWFFSDEPLELATTEYSEDLIDEVESRIEDFGKAMEEGEQVDPLVLTAEDLNALFAGDVSREIGDGAAYIEIVDDKLRLQMSIPLEEDFPGKYLNVDLKMGVELVAGYPVIDVDDVMVKGQPIPGWMQGLIDDFAEKQQKAILSGEADMSDFDESLESIRIEGDKLIIEAKQPESAE